MTDERRSSPSEDVRRLYEEAESRTARAFEEVVSRNSFGELLARVTENVVAVTKISTDVFDLVLRNLRLAGRQDITRLGRQLARTEDKLELLLQEVERLQDERERAPERERESAPERERAPQRAATTPGTNRSNGLKQSSSRSGTRSRATGAGGSGSK
jgi:hypothetical protein